MTPLSYLAPTGMLGGGFSEDHFRAAVENHDLAFIACDSGSTDGGPAYLGAGRFIQSRQSVKRDLRLLILAARSKDIPLLIGSAGGAGANPNLEWLAGLAREIACEEDLHFTLATIPAEPERDLLLERLAAGRIHPLANAPAITAQTLCEADRIVAMMGPEPIVAAVEAGADVVIAGRASDAALFAALPVHAGLPAGLSWHAAKIMECGGAAVAQMDRPEGMICTITEDSFVLEPVSPHQANTPNSIASHALYETANPYRMLEPGGVMDLSEATYEAIDDRRVRVSGSKHEPAPYTVKLEGARLAGYQSMVLGGITDPVILDRYDAWMAGAQAHAVEAVNTSFGRDMTGEYELHYRHYGRDAVLADRQADRPSPNGEIGLLMVVLADTQEKAAGIAATAGHAILHMAVPEWQGLVSNLAFPFSPHVVDLGPTYSFTLNHAMELDDPLEIHRPVLEAL